VLSFGPLAWTEVCHHQMRSREENHARFDDINAVALGIGVDSLPCNKAWGQSMDIKDTRLRSDVWPHGGVGKPFGNFRDEDRFAERADIVLDENQKVVFAKTYPTCELPDIEKVLGFLAERSAASQRHQHGIGKIH
jgi:peroxiredoxin